ncbi:hypothetical protein BDN72DRAFT_64677 [Pluteus cervinus]|uniref:Uncharacterized protein n=1 Tax=Pluteus cervinus TaxID=181527 RepID=A0ACD3AQU8_9AGAR|nr:hypothetical protein BDN72DRAFT_64677 [Pluteus cervinus]
MGQFYDEIPDFLVSWIQKQHVFWVASAPLSSSGHVNISPKGFEGTFHIMDSHTVWYEDLTGSASETVAHIRENGRITILFNAFDGPPRIARLYGRGTVHEFGTPEYNEFIPEGTRQPGSRAVILVDVYKVGTNCGYAVPLFAFQSHRTQLHDWATKKEGVDIESETRSQRDHLRHVPSAAGASSTQSIHAIPDSGSAAFVPATTTTSSSSSTGPTSTIPLSTAGGRLIPTSTSVLSASISSPLSSSALIPAASPGSTTPSGGCVDRIQVQAPPTAEGGLRAFWKDKNLKSLDGLPGLTTAHVSPTRFNSTNAYTSAIYRTSLYERQSHHPSGASSGSTSTSKNSTLHSSSTFQSRRSVVACSTSAGCTCQSGPVPHHLSSLTMPGELEERDHQTMTNVTCQCHLNIQPLPQHHHRSLSSTSSSNSSPNSNSINDNNACTCPTCTSSSSSTTTKDGYPKPEDVRRVMAFMMGIFMTILFQRAIGLGQEYFFNVLV